MNRNTATVKGLNFARLTGIKKGKIIGIEIVFIIEGGEQVSTGVIREGEGTPRATSLNWFFELTADNNLALAA